MKVVFVYLNFDGPLGSNIGLGLLSTKLKTAGYEVSLIHLTKKTNIDEKLHSEITDEVVFVGLTMNTLQARDVINIAKKIKKFKDVPIVAGGPHATFYPKELISNKCINVICVGEGENCIVSLANSLKSGSDLLNVNNIWFKKMNKSSNLLKAISFQLRTFLK